MVSFACELTHVAMKNLEGSFWPNQHLQSYIYNKISSTAKLFESHFHLQLKEHWNDISLLNEV